MTSFEYDAFNRLKKVTDPANGVTLYTYDGNGNLLTVKDAKNQVTTFAYDPVNRLASTTDPLGKTESYTYNGADNLLTRVTPKNETISFAYDAVNQLLSKTLPGNLLTSYTYDQVGNLLTVEDPDSKLTMTYDLANRLTSVKTDGSPNQPAVTLTYTYDKNGNRLTLTDGTATNTYTYDALNRLGSLASPAGLATFAYDGEEKGDRLLIRRLAGTPTRSQGRFEPVRGRDVRLPLRCAIGRLSCDTAAECVQLRFRERLRQPALPVGGQRDRAGIQQRGGMQTGPGPVLDALHQSRAHGVPEYIAEHGEEMCVLLDRETLEAALPDMAAAVVMFGDSAGRDLSTTTA
ncbi:MAG: hypothetical protein AB1555_16700 [Nitrospirota bacterium]